VFVHMLFLHPVWFDRTPQVYYKEVRECGKKQIKQMKPGILFNNIA
jgi:hypothetical protein